MLSEDGEGCLDVEFLVSHFPGGHGGREVERGGGGKEADREGKTPKKIG